MIKFMYVLTILIHVSGEKIDESLISSNKSIPRVILGWRGSLGDVPYQVSFRMRLSYFARKYENFCGGSIVAANKILSAAHCFAEDPDFCDKFLHMRPSLRIPLRWVYAVAGTVQNYGMPASDSEGNGQWRRLRDVKYSTSFDFPYSDFCVVVTTRPFIFNDYVNFIPYASQNVDYSGTCLVSGFGSTSRFSVKPSGHLLLAHVPIFSISRKKCEELGVSGRKFICTAPPAGPHKGDSGGPLVCSKTNDPKENSSSGILVGLTCASYNIPPYYFVYTRISFHRELIDDYVNTSYVAKAYVYYIIIQIMILF